LSKAPVTGAIQSRKVDESSSTIPLQMTATNQGVLEFLYGVITMIATL
jgi:hypothetical protein